MTMRLAVYRDVIGRVSETFIPEQVRTTPDASPFYVGMSQDEAGVHALEGADRVLLADVSRFPTVHQEAMRLAGRIHRGWLRQIKSRQPDMVHAHFGVDAVWALPMVEALGVPLVTTFHGWDLTICPSIRREGGKHYSLYLRRRHLVFERAVSCIAVSEYVASLLERAGCPSDRIKVQYTGVDTDAFSPTHERDESMRPTILFVGRLESIKGPQDLLRAFPIVRSAVPDARVVFIGQGSLHSTLEDASVEIDGITILGAQPPEVVREWMRQATVVCVPSRKRSCGCGEAFGMVFIEAQAMGRPVVSYRHSGIVEAVADGVSGVLVEEGNIAAMADSLIRILLDDHLAARLGAAGRGRVLERFDLRTNGAELRELYRRTLSGATVSEGSHGE